jgi:hypothetical protein
MSSEVVFYTEQHNGAILFLYASHLLTENGNVT